MENLLGENIEIKKAKPKKQKKAVAVEEDAQKELEKKLKSKKLPIADRLMLINENVQIVLGKQRQNVVVIRDLDSFHNYMTNAMKSGRIAIDTETDNSLDPKTCKLMGLCLYYPGGKQAYIPINHVNYLTNELLPNQLTEKDCKDQLQRILNYKAFCKEKQTEYEATFVPEYPGQTFQMWYEVHGESDKLHHMDIIMHNGKFDYEVIKCTCDIEVDPDWDTMIASRLLDENEKAGLKSQYIDKIDPSQVKYDIEKFFSGVPYAVVDPSIFALYAATDSMMTDKLYLWQRPRLCNEDCIKLYNLFKNIEMPVVVITANMELHGVSVDQELGSRLHSIYMKKLENIDKKIDEVLSNIDIYIKQWRDSSEATEKTRIYEPKKSKKTLDEIEAEFTYFDKELGKKYKLGKSKIEQLDEQVNLASPVQLAILFYDILKAPIVSKKSPRATGVEPLKAIQEQLSNYLDLKKDLDEKADEIESDNFEKSSQDTSNIEENEEDPDDIELTIDAKDTEEVGQKDKEKIIKLAAAAELSSLILKRRGIMKLITTYIEVIPKLAQHWPDGKIRFHMSQLGADTGRFSSGGKIKYMENGEPVVVSGINIQNIPSKGDGKVLRMLFTASTDYQEHEIENNSVFTVMEYEEVETTEGWKYPKDLINGNIIITDEGNKIITDVKYNQNERLYKIFI